MPSHPIRAEEEANLLLHRLQRKIEAEISRADLPEASNQAFHQPQLLKSSDKNSQV